MDAFVDQHAPERPIAVILARRLSDARTELTMRWLERIRERIALEANRVFASEDLLDHMPLLIAGIAEFLEHPESPVVGDSAVVGKAMELGALRHAQGFEDHEILKEFELFGGIIFAFIARTVGDIGDRCSPTELAQCYQRLFQAVSVVEQATAAQFHELTRRRVAEREGRLRLFNRALTHQLRNQIGAARGAGELLATLNVDRAEQVHLSQIISRNLAAVEAALANLLELTRLEAGVRRHRQVRLRDAANEAVRGVREAAQAAGVVVRVAPDLPDIEVSAAAVELCLANLVSNAIKYADATKPERWVAVAGRILGSEGNVPQEVVVEVRDNGVGVADDDRPHLFEQFFRGDMEQTRTVTGTGLGLSIVRDTVEGLGGRVWAEFPPDGSVFAFALPCRRVADAAKTTAPPRGDSSEAAAGDPTSAVGTGYLRDAFALTRPVEGGLAV